MKNALKSLSFLTILGALIFITSCGDDDSNGGGIIIDGGDTGSFAVADGLYIAGISGTDTTIVTSYLLSASPVEGEGFAATERSGHFANYIYLPAGTYLFGEVADRNVTSIIGGTSSVVDSTGTQAGSYIYIETEADGSSFNIPEAGLYHVIYDTQDSDAYIVKVTSWGIIGSAVFSSACVSDGFSADVNLTEVSSSADGSSYSIENLILKSGTYKFRYNDNWTLGTYLSFTNFGGETAAVLTPGGANITIEEDGLYTVTLTIDDNGQFSSTLTKTGDAPACTFDPANFDWGIIGAATFGPDGRAGWDDHKLLIYDVNRSTGGTHVWRGVFPVKTGEPFKFRIAGWVERKSPGGENSPGEFTNQFEDGRLTDVEDNADRNWVLNTLPGGFIYAVISTDDQGATWDLLMDEAEFQVIGEGSPVGNWEAANGLAMTYNDDNASATLAAGDYTTAGWKIIINNSFDFNLGGTIDGTTPLLFESDAFGLSAAGNYSVTVNTADGGESFTATATENVARQ